jgi:hypothetical protein
MAAAVNEPILAGILQILRVRIDRSWPTRLYCFSPVLTSCLSAGLDAQEVLSALRARRHGTRTWTEQ